ncbi:MAG TPA: hypothetical protein G4N96_13655 [Chloroflexi bacterium]|nr:hypothetical protein [Chloroflexota bacterium]
MRIANNKFADKQKVHLLIRPFAHSPIHPFTHSPIRPFAYSPIRHSPIRHSPFAIRPFTHSPIRPFAHSLFPLELYGFVREKQLVWGDVTQEIMGCVSDFRQIYRIRDH